MKSTSNNWQRTPISYYGGKQTMLPHILPLIPEHTIYTETFFGGGAVFLAKQSVKTEIINDFNANVYTFYKVLQNRFYRAVCS
jgi:DNA adenine methylase